MERVGLRDGRRRQSGSQEACEEPEQLCEGVDPEIAGVAAALGPSPPRSAGGRKRPTPSPAGLVTVGYKALRVPSRGLVRDGDNTAPPPYNRNYPMDSGVLARRRAPAGLATIRYKALRTAEACLAARAARVYSMVAHRSRAAGINAPSTGAEKEKAGDAAPPAARRRPG